MKARNPYSKMIIMDITSLLLLARHHEKDWTRDKFDGLLVLISQKIPEVTIDFDYDAGEDWARVISGPKSYIVALIRFDMPLMIMANDFREYFATLTTDEIITISIFDMDSKVYSLDVYQIRNIFPNNVWVPDIDPEQFSINDLWWTTST